MKTAASKLKVILAVFAASLSMRSELNAQNCSLPAFPDATITTTQDRDQMMCQLGVTIPTLPSKLVDPNRPPSAYPKDSSSPEGDWRNFYGHTITRSMWGLWNNYEDTTKGFLQADGFNGWDRHTINDPDSWRVFDEAGSQYAQGSYTPIDLLKMKDGTRISTQAQWWSQRRPEIFHDVQEELYGVIPANTPAVTFTTELSTGTGTNGIPYLQKVITGVIDISSYPQVRNPPTINAILRTPLTSEGTVTGMKVPVMITIGDPVFANIETYWGYTSPRGIGSCVFFITNLQPDSGGANLSSYLIGLINKGSWRKPSDMGALAAWAWGVSRLVDYFETDADVDARKLIVEGHSRYGKATIVAMAYEPRLAMAYPSRGGSGGPKMNRRHWGQDLENSLGSTSEYHWYAGNAYKYVGPLIGDGSGTVSNATDLPTSGPYAGNNQSTWRTLYPTAGSNTRPDTYLPRRLELMTVDAHSLLALAAPRPVFLNGGTHDSWTDFTGMYLAGVNATAVYEFLGRPGMIMPDAQVQRNTPYILGRVGYEYAGEPVYTGGHTDADDMATFLNFAARYLGETNVALASNGATVSVSSSYANGAYPASSIIDGDHVGAHWGNNGGWNDGTRNAYPDIAEVDFNGSKSLNEIRVYTLANNWKSGVEPTVALLPTREGTTVSATAEGILDFLVQTWNGTVWLTVPGGNVTGNTKAVCVFTFATAITTTKIRVVVNNARNNWSRIVEVEAFGIPAP